MKRSQIVLRLITFCALVGISCLQAGLAQSTPSPQKTGQSDHSTPPESKVDRALTQKVRRAIYADKSLSTAAHNVKISVRDGLVTLRGPVPTEEEKRVVEAKAEEVVGAGKIKSELTVSADHK